MTVQKSLRARRCLGPLLSRRSLPTLPDAGAWVEGVRRVVVTALFGGLCLLGPLPLSRVSFAEGPEPPTPQQLEFFEKSIRPLLVARCLECHNDKKQQGELRLDSHAAMLKGNSTGPALIPGKRAESRLMQVLAYSKDDVQMPPAGKLPQTEIDLLGQWIEMGAPWPAESPGATGGPRLDPKQHWSYQPMQAAPIPRVKDTHRPQTWIDNFILSRLEADGLTLAPPADRATLLRRWSIDLLGLPPTAEEVAAFVSDPRPDAPARALDALLASPAYGERWARFWLDIARYADSKGYVFTEEPRYPYAYTYRDYVIEAFNEDKPYDRFIVEQLAADQLDLGDDTKDLAALGFLTVGRRFLNNQHDIIDDRIDVVTRGLMGLTVACARCHDHKFDPVPTADYYSLYGVFASSFEPGELPVIGTSRNRTEFAKFEAEMKLRTDALAKFEAETAEKISQELRTRVDDYLTMIVRPKPPVEGKPEAEPRAEVVKRWRDYLGKRPAAAADPIFGLWTEWTKLPEADFAKTVAAWCEAALRPDAFDAGPHRVNRLIRQAILEDQPTTPVELARSYGTAFSAVYREWQQAVAANKDLNALKDPAHEELRQILVADGSPTVLKPNEFVGVYYRSERDKQRQLIKQIESLKATSPGAPPRAMVLLDKQDLWAPKVFIRGNPGRQGTPVPRQFLEVVAGPERKPFAKGSGRRELAEQVVSARNPLTARVLVNRIWQHHFGKGLVRSHGDFGIRGEPPTHPELLDLLALEAIRSGWSIKHLHRLILSSAVYQQSSQSDGRGRQLDPENRLLWAMSRQRLDLEAMRDAWLAVTGELDLALGGRPFDSITDANSRRRTVYGFVNRNDLPNVFRSFDFANTDASDPERPQTTVPQQALFGLNAPFVQARARTAAQLAAAETEDHSARVTRLYRQVLQRQPTSEELRLGREFLLQPAGEGKQSRLEQLAQALLLTNEFLFVD